jgi:hypothetical protein
MTIGSPSRSFPETRLCLARAWSRRTQSTISSSPTATCSHPSRTRRDSNSARSIAGSARSALSQKWSQGPHRLAEQLRAARVAGSIRWARRGNSNPLHGRDGRSARSSFFRSARDLSLQPVLARRSVSIEGESRVRGLCAAAAEDRRLIPERGERWPKNISRHPTSWRRGPPTGHSALVERDKHQPTRKADPAWTEANARGGRCDCHGPLLSENDILRRPPGRTQHLQFSLSVGHALPLLRAYAGLSGRRSPLRPTTAHELELAGGVQHRQPCPLRLVEVIDMNAERIASDELVVAVAVEIAELDALVIERLRPWHVSPAREDVRGPINGAATVKCVFPRRAGPWAMWFEDCPRTTSRCCGAVAC